MRWLTREWHTGALSDDEYEARSAAYEAHVASLACRVPDLIARFARPQTMEDSVHDGIIDIVEIDPAARLMTLRVLNGDLQHGYGKLDIVLTGASLLQRSITALRAFVVDPRTEILAHEVEIIGDGPGLLVSFLLWPEGELVVTADDIRTRRRPIADRTRTDVQRKVSLIAGKGR